MPEPESNILNYARTRPVNRYAKLPVLRVVFLAVVIPGLASSLIRSSPKPFFMLFGAGAVAFGVFGPLWGEILFKNTKWQETGVYPFLLVLTAVEFISVSMAIKDRYIARNQIHE